MIAAVERRDLLALVAGPTVWAFGFSALYGLQGAGCQLGWDHVPVGPSTLLRVLLVLLWAAHLAAAAWAARWTVRRDYLPPDGRVLRFAAIVLGVTGLVAMLWTGLPVMFTSMCAT